MSRIIGSLDDISDRYDAIFCDLWGCLHNGYTPHPDAVAALERFGAKGGKVILLTNSPRPTPSVVKQLDTIGVDRALYHGVATSGDAAQTALASGAFGRRVFHLGPDRDMGFFSDMADDLFGEMDVELVPLDQAQGIVCTGPVHDDVDTPDDYADTFLYAKTKGLKLLCANPDTVVDRGDRRIYCAGALAEAYTRAGGQSFYFGKPHAPIYLLARARLVSIGCDAPDERILCIGDGINTDIRGAIGEDLDCLFISGGLARVETQTADHPDPDLLAAFLDHANLSPPYSIGQLR